MTTTADWLHLKLGLSLADHADETAAANDDADNGESNLIARQRAYAAGPLSVTFPGR
ncbi:MAG TPA: hypothetical protein VGC10_02505 [Sphingomonas sp.]